MQGLDTQSTLKNLIFMYKGSQTCKAEATDFKLCRATPAGKIGDPERCEAKVSNFLACYSDMIKESKVKCADQYANAMNCMTKNVNASGDEGVCAGSLEAFARCK